MKEDDFQFVLVGFVRLTDHGFTLPCYASGAGRNTLYIANSSNPYSHEGIITSFEPFNSEAVEFIDDTERRTVRNGDFWIDVFLWRGSHYVGTPAEIYGQLHQSHDEISAVAPITLLDLACSVNGVSADLHARRALHYVQQTFNDDVAQRWLRESFLEKILMDEVYKSLSGARIGSPKLIEEIQDLSIATNKRGNLIPVLPATVEDALRTTKRLKATLVRLRRMATLFSLTVANVQVKERLAPSRSDARARLRSSRRLRPRQENVDLMLAPIVRAVLDHFPGAEIISVRSIP